MGSTGETPLFTWVLQLFAFQKEETVWQAKALVNLHHGEKLENNSPIVQSHQIHSNWHDTWEKVQSADPSRSQLAALLLLAGAQLSEELPALGEETFLLFLGQRGVGERRGRRWRGALGRFLLRVRLRVRFWLSWWIRFWLRGAHGIEMLGRFCPAHLADERQSQLHKSWIK